MLVVGGCQLSLEREPHDTIELIDVAGPESGKHAVLPARLPTPARGATAHIIDGCLWVIGGCKGPKEHLNLVQILKLDQKASDTS